MVDGKHLELNMAKASTKQIFYTNSSIFQKLNMQVICYDPGWLSYHGISIENKKANTQHLIPPEIASYGIIYTVSMSNIDEHVGPVYDCSVYDYVNDTKI